MSTQETRTEWGVLVTWKDGGGERFIDARGDEREAT